MPKTSLFQTTINVVKSYVGLGILAAPQCYLVVGYVIATLVILVNGILNTYTAHLQIKCKEEYGKKVKTYSDLGKACYGKNGEKFVAFLIIVGQFCLVTSYVMFFIEQMNLILEVASGYKLVDNDFSLYCIAILILAPLSLFESMQQISFICLTAISSIFIALIYVVYIDTA
jgi:amino acid permease